MELLTTGRAAKILGVAKTTVYRWCEQGRVPNAIKVKTVGWLIPVESLDRIDRPQMGGRSHKSYQEKNGNGTEELSQPDEKQLAPC